MCNYALSMPQAKEAARMYLETPYTGQIAQSLGVSPAAVRSVLPVLGVPKRTREEANAARGVFLEKDGLRMNLSQWARHLGIPYPTLRSRYQAGKSVEEILR
jgi:DNA-directed RNA polymerase specialized sigma24 family protein